MPFVNQGNTVAGSSRSRTSQETRGVFGVPQRDARLLRVSHERLWMPLSSLLRTIVFKTIVHPFTMSELGVAPGGDFERARTYPDYGSRF